MTREQAIAKARTVLEGPCPRGSAELQVDLLSALGLLKLDEPKASRTHMVPMASGRYAHIAEDTLIDTLRTAGYEVTK